MCCAPLPSGWLAGRPATRPLAPLACLCACHSLPASALPAPNDALWPPGYATSPRPVAHWLRCCSPALPQCCPAALPCAALPWPAGAPCPDLPCRALPCPAACREQPLATWSATFLCWLKQEVGLGRVLLDRLGLETVVRLNSPVKVGGRAGGKWLGGWVTLAGGWADVAWHGLLSVWHGQPAPLRCLFENACPGSACFRASPSASSPPHPLVLCLGMSTRAAWGQLVAALHPHRCPDGHVAAG